jgi:hypothetical protein
MNNFYTYAYLREDGTPYYIGKGKENRAYISIGRNCKNPPENRILFLKENLTEEEAFRHEMYMISVLGRKDNNTGILRNLTDGGEGTSGRVVGEETRRKMSKSQTGREISEEHRIKLSGEGNGKSKTWRITFSDGRQIVKRGLTIWCKDNGYSQAHVSKIFKKQRQRHKDIVAVDLLE